MLFSALAAPAIYACAPSSVKEMAKPQWLQDIGAAVSASLAAKSEAEVSSVDPIAAAKVDEDLDYRIAERTKSTAGWRAFLAAHPDGPHAQSARAELDKLAAPAPAVAQAPAPMVAQAPDVKAADAKVPSESASTELQSTVPAAATVATDETCSGDEDRLQRLSGSPTSDGILRLLIDLRCEKLRPEVLSLAKRLDDKPPAATPADATQDASPSALPASVASAPPLPPPRMRANEPSKRTHSHSAEPKGYTAQRAGPNLPQFLMAFFGGGSRNSTGARRVQTASRAGH